MLYKRPRKRRSCAAEREDFLAIGRELSKAAADAIAKQCIAENSEVLSENVTKVLLRVSSHRSKIES